MKFAKKDKCRRRALYTFLLLSLSFTASALAWDGQRQGFILGAGAGPGFYSYTSKEESPEIITRNYDRLISAGFQFNFKIGFAPTDRLLFHLTTKASVFGEEHTGKTTGITGLGADYYLKPNPPSLYITGVAGLSWWGETLLAQQIIYESTGFHGFGISGGFGYEFSQHLSAEFSLNWGNPSESVAVPPDSLFSHQKSPAPPGYITADRTYYPLSIGLTINALGY